MTRRRRNDDDDWTYRPLAVQQETMRGGGPLLALAMFALVLAIVAAFFVL